MNPTLLLLRHGETSYTQGPHKRVTGTLDAPLSEGGAAYFERVAGEYRRLFRIARLVTSPWLRARETAHLLIAPFQQRILVSVEDALRPWDNGLLRGHQVEDVKLKLDYLQRYPDMPAPAGESYRTFTTRMIECLRRLLKQAGADRERGVVVVVTHSGNVDVALAWHSAGMRGTRVPVVGKEKEQLVQPGHATRWTHVDGRWLLEPVEAA